MRVDCRESAFSVGGDSWQVSIRLFHVASLGVAVFGSRGLSGAFSFWSILDVGATIPHLFKNNDQVQRRRPHTCRDSCAPSVAIGIHVLGQLVWVCFGFASVLVIWRLLPSADTSAGTLFGFSICCDAFWVSTSNDALQA